MSESRICNLTVLEDWRPVSFENTRAIEYSHAKAPRFGHTNDVMNLVDGTKEEQMDYLMGLVSACIFLFCVFTVWTIILIFFKCRGPQRYGWLSGRRLPLPPRPREKEQPEEEEAQEGTEPLVDETEIPKEPKLDSVSKWEANYEKIVHHNKLMKFAVFFGCLFICISAILCVTKGAKNVKQATDDAQVSLGIAGDILDEADGIVVSIIDAVTNVQKDVIALLEAVNGICPKLRDQICEDLGNPQTCNTTGIFDGLVMEAVIDHFNSTNTVIYQMEEFQDDIGTYQKKVQEMDEKVENFTISFVLSSVLATMLCCLCFYMVVALLVQRTRMMNCLQNFLVFPSFILLVTLSFVLSLVFIIGSLASSDVCADGPDDRLKDMFEIKFGATASQILQELVVLYLTQCEVPLKELTADFDFLLNGENLISQFSDELSSFQEKKQAVCGATDVNLIEAIAQRLPQYICTTADILQNIRIFFRCETWYPLYQKTMHVGVCHSANQAFAWIAATQFVIAFMAIIVLTFRAALWDVEVMEEVSDLELEEEGMEGEYKVESLESEGSGTHDLSPESIGQIVEENGVSDGMCQVLIVDDKDVSGDNDYSGGDVDQKKDSEQSC